MKTKFLFAALCLSSTLQAQELKLTVSNPSDRQRQEVVSADARRIFRMLGHNGLRVFNARGLQVDYQITHDSLLLVDASVRPHGTTTFILRPGKPEPMHVWVSGALYKEREDDIAWENDRCAYRVYGPALQRSGEKAYGVDVWVKNTPEIVAPERYRLNIEGARFMSTTATATTPTWSVPHWDAAHRPSCWATVWSCHTVTATTRYLTTGHCASRFR